MPYPQFRIMPRLMLLIGMMVIMPTGCQMDPDPDPSQPDPNRFYVNMYNFQMEGYEVEWNIHGVDVEPSQAYGNPLLSYFALDDIRENITLMVQEAGSNRVILSDTCTVEQNHYYLACLMGSEEDSILLIEPMDLSVPSLGKIKLRFMQTAMEAGPVDVYIGGSSPEHKLISGMAFSELSDYLEASEEELWESVIITPFDRLPSDTSLLSFMANEVFEPGRVYMGVIGHQSSSPSSSLQLLLYNQPVGL